MVVDYFGVEYSVKEHDLYLKTALKDNYKVTTYWEGKLYNGIALKWDYEKGTVQISMAGYVRSALHSFTHEKNKRQTKRLKDSPYPWT